MTIKAEIDTVDIYFDKAVKEYTDLKGEEGESTTLVGRVNKLILISDVQYEVTEMNEREKTSRDLREKSKKKNNSGKTNIGNKKGSIVIRLQVGEV